MNVPHYDVLIVGAGAAGCAAAMSLPQGVTALLIDSGDPERGRCCGGLLAPDAQYALGRVGLVLPPSTRLPPEPCAVHVLDLDSGAEQTYRRRYVNIDRARFDAWLLSIAREVAEFRPRTRLVAVAVQSNGTVAELRRDDRIERVRARVLVGADGARSKVRRLVFPERPGPQAALAIQVRLSGGVRLRRHEVLFASRLTGFYAWAIPKGDSVLVGSAFERIRGAPERFERILGFMRGKLSLHGGIVQRGTRLMSRPRSGSEMFAGAGQVLLAGEAAGLISPSSGEGLSFAIESGAVAGRAIGSAQPAEACAGGFGRLTARVRRKLFKARVIFTPQLRRIAMLLPWCP